MQISDALMMIGGRRLKIFNCRNYLVHYLKVCDLKPFTIVRGPITFEEITKNNLNELKVNFPQGKIDVFKEKLERGCVGLYAKFKDEVVGYMWRKDYNSTNVVKADGYLPLKGKFSHIHFARVHPKMRGRGLQLLLMTKLILDAKDNSIQEIYTDTDVKNPIAARGIVKLGFRNIYRLLVIRFNFGKCISIKYKSKYSF